MSSKLEDDTLYMRVVGATGPGHPSRDVLYALLRDVRRRMEADYALLTIITDKLIGLKKRLDVLETTPNPGPGGM